MDNLCRQVMGGRASYVDVECVYLLTHFPVNIIYTQWNVVELSLIRRLLYADRK